jgi:hypothetical protein
MQQQQQGMQYMNTQHAGGRPAEVAGDSNRSKAQLIVGIDFVSCSLAHTPFAVC